MQELYFTFAIIITIVGFVKYYILVDASITESNIVSWGLWTLIGFDVMINIMISSNDLVEIVQGFILFSGPLLITFALYKRGKAKIGYVTSFEWKCITIAILLFVLVIFLEYSSFESNFAKNILSVSIIILDFVVFLPLLKDIINNTDNESYVPWLLWAIGNFLAILAIKEFSFAAISFLGYVSLVTLLVTIYIVFKTKLKKATS